MRSSSLFVARRIPVQLLALGRSPFIFITPVTRSSHRRQREVCVRAKHKWKLERAPAPYLAWPSIGVISALTHCHKIAIFQAIVLQVCCSLAGPGPTRSHSLGRLHLGQRGLRLCRGALWPGGLPASRFQEVSGGWQAFFSLRADKMHPMDTHTSICLRCGHARHALTPPRLGPRQACLLHFPSTKKFWCLCRPVFSKYFGCSVAFRRNLDPESSGWGA
ncbi:uncharacterized protein LOC119864429 [Canis lupus familiaris]|uniref:uncharacterized protein LOC119864429 n=1 Tax=Canis lupus familiaris TaxID=9615 RepID=UPI0018F6C82D|nr:uncharacterized protein LOC119864429 [Canis lupus familiaris]XP_038310519.1 uncharacterized protein LOC119864429 [Canis lupus familiaris]XP_038420512.1 uncharacterized protein LOC119864429 [Canis lupus familiaris]XP_048953276.1 uncharacterized protein LOC125753041 [Canis lupus dingo]